MPETYTSSSYYYSSATSTTDGTKTTGHRYTTTSHTDPDGNTIVRTAHQELGEPPVIEERRYDRTGQQLHLGSSGVMTVNPQFATPDFSNVYGNYGSFDNSAMASTNTVADDMVDSADAIDPVTGRRYYENARL
ncbi:hypothetical protein VTN49DRAFT_8072 [Thermomyces lanuginosus]|uniref:uncharacterized protein n=1 Tax=Thermomyces lanuginosus TaxID=5541 RepID=UPI003742A42F